MVRSTEPSESRWLCRWRRVWRVAREPRLLVLVPVLVLLFEIGLVLGLAGMSAETARAQSRSLSDEKPIQATPLEEVSENEALDLDDLDEEQSLQPDESGEPWRPGPCRKLSSYAVETPVGSRRRDWQAVLDRARQAIPVARAEVEQATNEYSGALNQGAMLPGTRARLGEKRDTARRHYTRTICEFRALLEAARDAGIQPGVLRPYRADVPDMDG